MDLRRLEPPELSRRAHVAGDARHERDVGRALRTTEQRDEALEPLLRDRPRR